MHPVRVQCANLSVWLTGGNKTKREQKNITVPAVVAGTFRGRSRSVLTRHAAEWFDSTVVLGTRGRNPDVRSRDPAGSGSSGSGSSPVDAGVGSVIINVANTTQLAHVALGSSTASASSLTLFDAHRKPLQKWSVANGGLPPVVDLTLTPFEVVFLLAF